MASTQCINGIPRIRNFDLKKKIDILVKKDVFISYIKNKGFGGASVLYSGRSA